MGAMKNKKRRLFTVPVTITVPLLAVLSLVGCAGQEANDPPAADPLAGLSELVGTVTAEVPFTAAQVYARNLDKKQ